MLTTVLLFGGAYAEGYALANDQEQATSRVFEMARRIVECSPLLKREAKITQDRIVFPAFNATIAAMPARPPPQNQIVVEILQCAAHLAHPPSR